MTARLDYLHQIDRLNQRGLFRIKPGLERMRSLLRALGDPQDTRPTIHIAGTNGKGSVAASLESVLRQAGFRTGLYTSPHLQDIRERIQIDRTPISKAVFSHAAKKVFRAEHQTGQRLTYFEFLTAMAFLIFKQEAVDVVILEAGMGGRWDATNVIRRPALTIITSIGLDHTQWLGRTETAIAKEKAGIVKARVPVICGARGHAARVIARRAQAINSPFLEISRDFYAQGEPPHHGQDFQRITYTGLTGAERVTALHLQGPYQIDNAAVTLASLEVLTRHHWKIPQRAMEDGLSRVEWPGRFQCLSRAGEAPMIFDGAHNPSATRHLIEALQASRWRSARKVFVFGVYRDKNYRQMLKIIRPHAAHLILCTMPGERALPARIAARAVKGKAIRIMNNPHQALKAAQRAASPQDVVVVTGSLTLVGMLLKDREPAYA